MCKSIDVAVALLDKSIQRANAEGLSEYYMDSTKVHKMLYFAASYIRYKYEMDLFEETITAHNCGPYISGLEHLTLCCGFDAIKNVPDNLRNKVVPLPLSFTRLEVLDIVLNVFGKYSTTDIVKESKETVGYINYANKYDDHLEIEREDLCLTGKEFAAKYLGEIPT